MRTNSNLQSNISTMGMAIVEVNLELFIRLRSMLCLRFPVYVLVAVKHVQVIKKVCKPAPCVKTSVVFI